jgi:hypothetical protein
MTLKSIIFWDAMLYGLEDVSLHFGWMYSLQIQGTSPPGGTLSCLTRVVDSLHVKEPQASEQNLSAISRPKTNG